MSGSPFSVLMSVYRNDKPEFVRVAIESVTTRQTLKPSEVVLVVDGPVSDALANVIKEYENAPHSIFKVIWLPKNQGLGNALNIGLKEASFEIIARMDSDDVSMPNRFEKQIHYLNEHKDCSLIGGQIAEFIGTENNIVGKRIVPCENNDILERLKSRCPFNHMSVMMLRSHVIAAGNYIDWHFNEDYYLWIRMAEAKYNFANLPDVLVNVRVGEDMYRRRGGWKYFISEKGLQDYMLDRKLISGPRYCYNVLGRFFIQVAMPNRLRAFLFQKLFRKSQ